MITSAARTELEESILACCKSLFLTSAIPDLIRQDGTPKQVEYLAAALQQEVARREENKRDRLVKRARFPTYKTFDGYEQTSSLSGYGQDFVFLIRAAGNPAKVDYISLRGHT